jgi:hypothetical protein
LTNPICARPLRPTSLVAAVLATVLADSALQTAAPTLDPTSPFSSLTGAR